MEEKEPKWTEHLSKAVDEFLDEVKGTVPEDMKKHLKASIKEMLLATKSILDKGIEKLSEEKEKKGEKVKEEKAK